MPRILVLALVLTGCWGGGEPEAPPLPPLVHPLASAPSDPWVQEVWFVAEPGERVGQLGLSNGATQHPVVTLVAPDGTRRALQLVGPGEFHSVDVVGRPEGGHARSASSADGALRVVVESGDQVTVTVTDARTGKRTVVVRDLGVREITNPSLDPRNNALYLDARGNLGGVYRSSLPDGDTVRVVPALVAGRPVAWPDAGGERIAYVEEGDPQKVVVARPVGSLPLRPVADMVGEGRVPTALVPVVLTLDGRPLRLESCSPPEPLVLVTPTGGAAIGKVDVPSGRYCGRGCTELVGRTPDGAPRLLATLSVDPMTGVWTTSFDPSLGLATPTWIEADKVDTVPSVPACVPPASGPLWLHEPFLSVRAPDRLVHAEVIQELLVGYGFKGKHQPVTVKLARGGEAQSRPVMNPTRPPGDTSTSRDGSATAKVHDGNLVVQEVATGAVSVLLEGGGGRRLRHPAFALDGSGVFVVDDGPEGGLLLASVPGGQVQRVLALPGVQHPVPVTWADRDRVVFVRQASSEVSSLGAVTPFDEPARAAWSEGLATLTRYAPVWLPVQSEGGGLVRCTEGDAVRFWVDERGGFVHWGEVRAPVRAARWDGRELWLMDEVEGVPTLVVEMRWEGPLARFWPVSLPVAVKSPGWLPETEANELPLGGPCTVAR